MSDLDNKEQNHVRSALSYLYRRLGTWGVVAKALNTSTVTLKHIMSQHTAVSASMALRVARTCGAMIDDLLVGKFLPPGACPNCGHVAVPDFADDSTVVEDAPRRAVG